MYGTLSDVVVDVISKRINFLRITVAMSDDDDLACLSATAASVVRRRRRRIRSSRWVREFMDKSLTNSWRLRSTIEGH